LQIRRTKRFDEWISGLKDRRAKARIGARLDRLAEGNPGNARSVGGGVVELKIDVGPGYRVYYIERGTALLYCFVVAIRAHSQTTSSQRRDWLR
jgi:putative addiction module killer protein